MQHEITKPIPLLDDRGNLTEPGWARRPLPVYDRSRVKGGPARRKEWDYYLVMGDGFALALTIADSSCLGVASISLLDFQEGGQVTRSPVRLLPMGATGLPGTSQRGNAAVSGRGYALLFHNDGQNRTLTAHMERFREDQTLDAHVILTEAPPESMVICTPFGKPGHFHYNQKINGLRAQGTVRLGEQVRRFEPETAFGTLDWGRGVWTWHNTWYWASASGRLDGVPFGFNLGCGFGDTSAATENAVFYDGRVHKLSDVAFRLPWDRMAPWTFTGERCALSMTPVLDRSACAGAGPLRSEQHQIFGRFNGTVVLDDGTKTLPCAINVVTDEPGRTVMEMTLKEGKNREIRRMCETVGLEVVRLKRNAEGVVKLGMLKPGTYRELTKAEINGLRAAAAKGRAQTRSAAVQSKAAERRPRGPVGKGTAPKKRK